MKLVIKPSVLVILLCLIGLTLKFKNKLESEISKDLSRSSIKNIRPPEITTSTQVQSDESTELSVQNDSSNDGS